MPRRRRSHRDWSVAFGLLAPLPACTPRANGPVPLVPDAPHHAALRRPRPTPAHAERAAPPAVEPPAPPDAAASAAPRATVPRPVERLGVLRVLPNPFAGRPRPRGNELVALDGELLWLGATSAVRDALATGVRAEDPAPPREMLDGRAIRCDDDGLLLRETTAAVVAVDLRARRTRWTLARSAPVSVGHASCGPGLVAIELLDPSYRPAVPAKLIGVDPVTGHVRWQRPLRELGMRATVAMARTAGALIVSGQASDTRGGGGGMLVALDPRTGATRWQLAVPHVAPTFALAAGRLVVASQYNELRVLDAASGRELRRVGLTVRDSAPAFIQLAPDGAAAYVSGPLPLTAIDLGTGAVQWQFEGELAGPGAVDDEDVVYATSVGDLLHAVDRATGRPRWSFGLGAGAAVARVGLPGGDAVLVARNGNDDVTVFRRGEQPAPPTQLLVEGRVVRRGYPSPGMARRSAGAGLAINGTPVPLDAAGNFRARVAVRGQLVFVPHGDWREESFAPISVPLAGGARQRVALESWLTAVD